MKMINDSKDSGGHPSVWLRPVLPYVKWFIMIGCLGMLFYVEEDFRWERAWRSFQQQQMIPASGRPPGDFSISRARSWQDKVADSNMMTWFLQSTPVQDTPFSRDFMRAVDGLKFGRWGAWGEGRPTDLQEWRDYFREQGDVSGELEEANAVREEDASTRTGQSSAVADDIVPSLVIDGLPLGSALESIGRQAELNLRFSPEARDRMLEERPLLSLPISIRFEMVTAREAVESILHHYGLDWVETTSPNEWNIVLALAPAPDWLEEAVDLNTAALGPKADEIVPLVLFDDVPVSHAVRNIARAAGFNFQFHRDLLHESMGDSCSLQLTNVTLRAALKEVLELSDWALQAIGNTGIYQVVPADYVLPCRSEHTADDVLQVLSPLRKRFGALLDVAPWMATEVGNEVVLPQGENKQDGGYDFTRFRRVAQALTLHASAALSISNQTVALEDATALWHVANLLKGEPDLTAAMIHVALTGQYLQVVWEGLAARRWNEEALIVLQGQLASIDVVTPCARGLDRELAAFDRWIEQTPRAQLGQQLVERVSAYQWLGRPAPWWSGPVRLGLRWGPRGWIRQVQICYHETFQTQLDQLNLQTQRVIPADTADFHSSRRRYFDLLTPVRTLIRQHGWNFVKPIEVATRQQTGVRQAWLACALERYRLGHGTFPETLEALVPRFADQLPNDLVSGQGYHYRPTHDGQFVLYAVGWDQRDDWAGAGDWVWRYPER